MIKMFLELFFSARILNNAASTIPRQIKTKPAGKRAAATITTTFVGPCAITMSLLLTTGVQATPFIPSSPEHTVAKWKPGSLVKHGSQLPQNPAQALKTADIYLQSAALPGQENNYSLAYSVLKPLMSNNIQDAQIWYTWARILQHQHQFHAAQIALSEVFKRDNAHVAANLLAARIALIQGDIPRAKQQCLKLLGQTDMLTLSACSLEAASYADNKSLQLSYQQLHHLFTKSAANEDTTWIRQILADMALRLQAPNQALAYLTPLPSSASVSFLSQWADIQLALYSHQEILTTLGPIVRHSENADDALLIRLALAEKALAEKTLADKQLANKTDNARQLEDSTGFWQRQVAKKIALREARGDQQHAADLCIFYLDLQPDGQNALKWAQINWQQAKEPADKILLARARTLANL